MKAIACDVPLLAWARLLNGDRTEGHEDSISKDLLSHQAANTVREFWTGALDDYVVEVQRGQIVADVPEQLKAFR